MLTEIDILRDISERLDRIDLPYMLTGSMAMNYYAVPRMTRDIDLVIALPPPRTRKLVETLSPDYMIVEEAVTEAANTRFMFNAIHKESIIKIDFVCQKDEPFRREEFARRQRIELEDFETWIVTAEDLILSKLIWMKESGSEQQRKDVVNLLESPCDSDYLKRWANDLGVDALLESLIS